jgi:tetratricopeptide (TPR) repeat protein
MCRSLPLGFLLLSVLALGDGTSTGLKAEEPSSGVKKQVEGNETGPRRSIYLPKHASASSLAMLLHKQYEGDVGVSVVAEPNANVIAIRAESEADFQELLKTLTLIDKPARQVAFQVLIAELNEKPASEKGDSKLVVDPRELTGPVETVMTTLGKWTIAGHVAKVRRYSMLGLENQPCSLNLGETKPRVTGVTASARSAVPTLMFDQVGTSVEIVARITETRDIVTSLNIQDTWFEPIDKGIELAKDDKGRPLVVQGKVMSVLRTTLSIPDGQANVATEWQVEPSSNHVPSIVVILAEIVSADGPRKTASLSLPTPVWPVPNLGRPTTSNPIEPKSTSSLPQHVEPNSTSVTRPRPNTDPKSRPAFFKTPGERLAILDDLLKKAPNDASNLFRRSQVHVELQQWDKAIADAKSAIAAKPDDVNALTLLTEIAAYRRDEAMFRNASKDLLDRFGTRTEYVVQRQVAVACLIAPDWLHDHKKAEGVLEASLSGTFSGGAGQPEVFSKFFTAQQTIHRGWLEIRHGQSLAAIKTLEDGIQRLESVTSSRSPTLEFTISQGRLLLAIALQNSGEAARADESLKSAEDAIRRWRPDAKSERAIPVGHVNDWLSAEVLLRQAQLQIRGKESLNPDD